MANENVPSKLDNKDENYIGNYIFKFPPVLIKISAKELVPSKFKKLHIIVIMIRHDNVKLLLFLISEIVN